MTRLHQVPGRPTDLEGGQVSPSWAAQGSPVDKDPIRPSSPWWDSHPAEPQCSVCGMLWSGALKTNVGRYREGVATAWCQPSHHECSLSPPLHLRVARRLLSGRGPCLCLSPLFLGRRPQGPAHMALPDLEQGCRKRLSTPGHRLGEAGLAEGSLGPSSAPSLTGTEPGCGAGGAGEPPVQLLTAPWTHEHYCLHRGGRV